MSAYIFPTVLFQGLTFTAKQWGKYPTISYTIGAVAGAEVVSVSSTAPTHNITVQIQTGVSTTAQVKAAIEATSPSLDFQSAGDLVSIVITTPGVVTAPATSSAMSGAVAPNVLGFYMDQSGTTLTTSFQAMLFSFNAKFASIINDETTGTKQVIFSWDGINNHGILNPGQSMTIDTINANIVYLKEANGAPAYRLMAKPL
jgi:hypothetical protein